MLSDGFLNSRNTSGLPFAGDVAMEVLGPLRHEPLDRIVETLCNEAQRHTGRGTPLDDLTVLGLRFARSSGSRQHDRSSA
jgi:serine phosphatase RsbU (regulator of sigma subunit)